MAASFAILRQEPNNFLGHLQRKVGIILRTLDPHFTEYSPILLPIPLPILYIHSLNPRSVMYFGTWSWGSSSAPT